MCLRSALSCVAASWTQDDFGCAIETLCDALECLGVFPFISQDDIDDMTVEAFSKPSGVIV
jgi:hypothetical protein